MQPVSFSNSSSRKVRGLAHNQSRDLIGLQSQRQLIKKIACRTNRLQAINLLNDFTPPAKSIQFLFA